MSYEHVQVTRDQFRLIEKSPPEGEDALLVTAHRVWVVTVDPEDAEDALNHGCMERDWTTTQSVDDARKLATKHYASLHYTRERSMQAASEPEPQPRYACPNCAGDHITLTELTQHRVVLQGTDVEADHNQDQHRVQITCMRCGVGRYYGSHADQPYEQWLQDWTPGNPRPAWLDQEQA